MVKLVVLAVLMSGSFGAQAQRNIDVPRGPAASPPIKSPAPTQSSRLPIAIIRDLKAEEIAKVPPLALIIVAQ